MATAATTPISNLSAGWRTTCVVLNEQLQCFGWNQYGQIGVDSRQDQYLPIPVTTNLRGVDSVSPGVVHTCASDSQNLLYCWGSNDSVDLLLADPTVYPTPQLVTAIGGQVYQVTSGRGHICAVIDAGEFDRFVCWGGNEYGQLGINSNIRSDEPVDVQLSGIPKQISAGYLHQCAVLSTDDSLWCWGLNFNGQVGMGTTENIWVPTKVINLNPVKMVSSGYYHTCALTREGFVYCFGYNANGQLGNGRTDNASTPQFVYLGGRADIVATGHDHACAVLTDGSLKCWGSNSFGQLGVGPTTTQSTSALPVNFVDNGEATPAEIGLVKTIALGKDHTCATLVDETLWCWGSNSNGQLGLGEGIQQQYLPAQVDIVFSSTPSPTDSPSMAPVLAPTKRPTTSPTEDPTPQPTTRRPTPIPTPRPTPFPTVDVLGITPRPTTAKPTPYTKEPDPPTPAPSLPEQRIPSGPRSPSIILVFPTEHDDAVDESQDSDSSTSSSSRSALLSALFLTLLLLLRVQQ